MAGNFVKKNEHSLFHHSLNFHIQNKNSLTYKGNKKITQKQVLCQKSMNVIFEVICKKLFKATKLLMTTKACFNKRVLYLTLYNRRFMNFFLIFHLEKKTHSSKEEKKFVYCVFNLRKPVSLFINYDRSSGNECKNRL